MRQAEAELYRGLWNTVEAYGAMSPGLKFVDLFLDMSGAKPGQTVLDAAAGSGKAAVELARRGFPVRLNDITPAGLIDDARDLPFREVCLWEHWHDLADFVICCDVLEHIPTEYTMLVIDRLLEAARFGVFLTISLVPDQFGAFAGDTLHKTVREFVWWRDRLASLSVVIEARDLGATGIYYVRREAIQ